MQRPWFQMHSRDWLDNKELRRCSPTARGLLIDLMCVAHEGTPYGHLADKMGPLSAHYLYSRCSMERTQFARALGQLKASGRIAETDTDKCLYVPRMVRDEAIRLARSAGGDKSADNENVPRKKALEGYPSDHPSLKIDSRARMRADSDSDYSSSCVSSEESVRETTLTARYKEFIAEWSKPTEDGRRFTCADVDLGCQVWMSLIDKGTITESNVGEVFEGLERHRQSKKWNQGFVLSVPAFLGWAKNGTPAAPRWNDRPEQNADGGY